MRFRFSFANGENGPRDALSRMFRMHKEGANPGWFTTGVDHGGVTVRELVAAEKRLAFAPTAATDQCSILLCDVIGPVLDQSAVNTKNGRDRRFDLCIIIMLTTQMPSGVRNQSRDRFAIVERSLADLVVHGYLSLTTASDHVANGSSSIPEPRTTDACGYNRRRSLS